MELYPILSASTWGIVEYYVKSGLLPATSDQSAKSMQMQSLRREVQPLKLSVNLNQYKHLLFLGTVPVVFSVIIAFLQKLVKFVGFLQSAFFFLTSCLGLRLIFGLSAGENTLLKY